MTLRKKYVNGNNIYEGLKSDYPNELAKPLGLKLLEFQKREY